LLNDSTTETSSRVIAREEAAFHQRGLTGHPCLGVLLLMLLTLQVAVKHLALLPQPLLALRLSPVILLLVLLTFGVHTWNTPSVY